MVAVDDSRISQTAIPHGVAVASALDAELTLVRVLEAMRKSGDPADPVDWQISRERARSDIEHLAHQHADRLGHVETRIVEGRPADQICRWAHDNQVDLTVLCTHGGGGASDRDVGRTARRVLDCASGPVLLVPTTEEEPGRVQYRRILAFLDGSSRAESALPFALRLAEAEHAELVLVHAIPEPEFTETGPPEPEDVTLRAQLVRRNERVAQDYLDRLRAHIDMRDIPVRVLLLRDGDVRHALVHAVMDEKADLIVLASHGHSGHMDVAAGSVATHLISHAPVPVLLVRSPATVPSNGSKPVPLLDIANDARLFVRVAG
jgi:nucleotide-binding universal stress UspA family protein